MDKRSISEQLSAYGIEHEPGGDGRRFILWRGKPLGQMDSAEAANLLEILGFMGENGPI